MFKPGSLYRFKANRDVGFEVVKAYYVKERKRWNIKIAWYNIGNCHAPWPLGISERLTITAEQLKDVERITHNFRVPIDEFKPVYY